MSGHVTWVGKSSAESTLNLHQVRIRPLVLPSEYPNAAILGPLTPAQSSSCFDLRRGGSVAVISNDGSLAHFAVNLH